MVSLVHTCVQTWQTVHLKHVLYINYISKLLKDVKQVSKPDHSRSTFALAGKGPLPLLHHDTLSGTAGGSGSR